MIKLVVGLSTCTLLNQSFCKSLYIAIISKRNSIYWARAQRIFSPYEFQSIIIYHLCVCAMWFIYCYLLSLILAIWNWNNRWLGFKWIWLKSIGSHIRGLNVIIFCLFQWETLCEDSFLRFSIFDSIGKKWVKIKLYLVNKKFYLKIWHFLKVVFC